MDTALNLNPGVDTRKAFNMKNILTTVVIVVIVAFVISKLFKNTMVIKDNSGNQTGTANLSFTPFWKK